MGPSFSQPKVRLRISALQSEVASKLSADAALSIEQHMRKLREMLLRSARLQRPPHAPRVRWRQPERCRAKVHLSAFDERRAASSWGSIDRQLDCTEATVRLATVAPVQCRFPALHPTFAVRHLCGRTRLPD